MLATLIPISAEANDKDGEELKMIDYENVSFKNFSNELVQIQSRIWNKECITTEECEDFCMANTVNTFSQKFLTFLIFTFISFLISLANGVFGANKKICFLSAGFVIVSFILLLI